QRREARGCRRVGCPRPPGRREADEGPSRCRVFRGPRRLLRGPGRELLGDRLCPSGQPRCHCFASGPGRGAATKAAQAQPEGWTEGEEEGEVDCVTPAAA